MLEERTTAEETAPEVGQELTIDQLKLRLTQQRLPPVRLPAFVVWKRCRGHSPVYLHPTLEAATKESERLSALEPYAAFLIAEVKCVTGPKLTISPEEIPEFQKKLDEKFAAKEAQREARENKAKERHQPKEKKAPLTLADVRKMKTAANRS